MGGESGSLADMASSQEALSLHFNSIMQNNHVALIMHPASIMKVCLLVVPSSASEGTLHMAGGLEMKI